jgi:predicted enzyme related to lactoylglutathione lyase
MPSREVTPIGAPCWVDLLTSDPARSTAFYGTLFGWTASEPDEAFGGYFTFSHDGVQVAGCMVQQPGSEMPDVWTVYLASDDAAKVLETASADGGHTVVEPMAVGDLGTMAAISDPAGVMIGVWQPDTFQGFQVFGEANTPSWFELHTRDYDAAVAFYRDVFRWDTHAVTDSPEFRYTVLRDGDAWLAGIMDGVAAGIPADVPSRWLVYFGVDDTDATLARAVELGGSVLEPAEDTPYGRLATLADPTGTILKLVAPNEQMPARKPAS